MLAAKRDLLHPTVSWSEISLKALMPWAAVMQLQRQMMSVKIARSRGLCVGKTSTTLLSTESRALHTIDDARAASLSRQDCALPMAFAKPTMGTTVITVRQSGCFQLLGMLWLCNTLIKIGALASNQEAETDLGMQIYGCIAF